MPVLLVFGAWKTGALGFNCEDEKVCAEYAIVEASDMGTEVLAVDDGGKLVD